MVASFPESPVALLVFNRPEHTRKVFQRLREIKPKRLFIIADGPRSDKERELCSEVRKITEEIDWDCEVERKYSEVNMGCDPCSTAGLDWILSKVDRVIFLEDDGLAHPDFFPYCSELLERYKDDERIMMISGDNFQQHNPSFACPESYYFTQIPYMHGFAVWRRSWRLYDEKMTAWPEVKRRGLLTSTFRDYAVRAHFSYKFDQYFSNKLTNWDGKWLFAFTLNRGVSICPRVNLVTNIGYGPGATNSTNADDWKANLPSGPLTRPFIHPNGIRIDEGAEAYAFAHVFGINRSFKQKAISFSRHHFPRLYSLARKITP